jgi:hypothetical protein
MLVHTQNHLNFEEAANRLKIIQFKFFSSMKSLTDEPISLAVHHVCVNSNEGWYSFIFASRRTVVLTAAFTPQPK